MVRTESRPLWRLADAILRWRYALLLLAMIAALVSMPPALALRFDRTIQSMFPRDNPLLANYEEAVRLFGGQETGIVVYDDPNLLTVEGLEHLAAFTDQVGRIRGVGSARSLADMPRPSAPLVPGTIREQLRRGEVTPESLRDELLASDLLRGTLLGREHPDGSDGALTAAILFDFVTEQAVEALRRSTGGPAAVAVTPYSREQTIRALRHLIERHEQRHGMRTALVGEPILINDAFSYLEQDGTRLSVASSLILTLVIAVLFRNLRWMLLPLAVVHVSQFVTKAILYWTGAEMTMVSSPMVALITVIAVATVVHVTVRFREHRSQATPLGAMRRTAVTIGPAIFWTCVTTAAGFGSLILSSVLPVRSFGMMMALGALVVFFAAAALLPGGALLGRAREETSDDSPETKPGESSQPAATAAGEQTVGSRPRSGGCAPQSGLARLLGDPQRPPGEGRLALGLGGIVRAVERWPWWIALVTAAVLGFAALGFFRIQVATEFTENYREGTPIVEAYQFVSDRFGAVGSFDVMIDAPEEFDADFLENLRALEQRIDQVDFVAKTLSVADFIEAFPPLMRPVLINALNNPEAMQATTPQLAGIVGTFWNSREGVLRIAVHVSGGQQAEQKRETIEAVEAIVHEEFPRARLAGVYILLTYLVETLLADQWRTFAVAVCAIFVMMAAAFRSWQLGFAALVPNVTPILIVIGLMGWIGMKLNVATAMIASVSMGLAIDFSIHYLYRFRRELDAGKTFYEALAGAHQSVGLALVLANIALVAGFSVLVLSTFIPTVHFGILVSVAMLGGLAGNLVILPLLLAVLPAARKSRKAEGESEARG